MNLASVRIITDDIVRLVAFYEGVAGTTAVWSTGDFAEVHFASATLAIGSTATVALFAPGSALPARNASAIIELIVDDVDAEWERLRPWVADVVVEPTTMPWGNRALVLRDPDGTLVNLFTPVSEAAVAKFATVVR